MPGLFTDTDTLIALVILLLAYGFRGITGFGSSLVAVPLLALLYPLQFVVPFMTLLDWFASTFHGIRYRKQARWSLILPTLPFILVGIVVALYIFKTIDALLLVKTLGIFILGFGIYSLIAPVFKTHDSKIWAALAGLLGGSVSTLFGTGGPFYVVYLQFKGIPKGTFRATIASIFIIEGALRVAGYTLVNFYTVEMLGLVLLSLPVMVIAMNIGGHIHTTISQKNFQRSVGVLLLASGLALLYK